MTFDLILGGEGKKTPKKTVIKPKISIFKDQNVAELEDSYLHEIFWT